eukprot:XP_011674892.1 PREDICTED: uncharacterized protein LOC100888596 isoform X2 [Strongylocentrotus purpuratus]
MAAARKEIDNFDDIDFQDEVEIICNFLRWDSFPKSGTENFKRLLEKRAQDFCVEAYIPTDDASPALPWQLFYTGSPESSGDEQVEYLQEVGEPQEGQSEGSKRLVIPHPRKQHNVLSKVHEGKEGVHLTGYEMWEKIIPVYYWRHIRTSIIDFLRNCETCKLQDPGTGPETSPGTDFGTSGSSVNNDGFSTFEEDGDEAFEKFQLSNELPYHEEVDQVYNYLKKGKYPANTTINFKRCLRRKAQHYVLGDDDADETNGVSSRKLYFLKARERRARRSNAGAEGQEGEDVRGRLVVPLAGEQQRILQVVHIGPSGGHCGRDKMLSSISQDYFWKGMYQSVVSFLETCSECKTKRSDAKRKSLNQQDVKKTPTTKQATKKVKRDERVMTRSCTQAYNSLATQKEHFIRRTVETFNYLKDRSYPLNITPDAKRDIRRRSHCFTIGQSEAEEWPGIYGHSEPEERLYYLKKVRRTGGQEEVEEEDDEDRQGREEKPCRRLVVTTEEEQNVAIMKVHVDENGMHISQARTYSILAELYYWLDMKTSVKKYIYDCNCPLPPHGRVPEDQQTGDSPVLKQFSIKLHKVIPPSLPVAVKKEKLLLPPELTELPEGLSHIARISTEMEALIVYLYLKWQKYPPGCTVGFKRMVRKKARSFCFEEDGGDNEDKTWWLFYRGDSNRGQTYTGQVVEAQETTGDATDIERARVQEADGIAEPMETAESTGTEESEEMGKAVRALEIVESEVTVETDTVSPKVPVMIRKERSMYYGTRNRLFVFRKAEQEKIIQLLHLNGGKNGEHAGRDRIYNMIGRHFFWRGLRDHIMFVIMKCKRCHRKKTAGKSTDYALYLQDLYNKSNEDAFDEDLSSHQLPLHIQTYLENALRMEAEWEAEDHRQGTIVNSNGSFTEADQAVHGLVKDTATKESRLADGDIFCRHPCDSCHRRFRDRDSLRRHKWAQHTGRRSSVECTVCGKKTKDLLTHMRCHTKERPLECELCNKRFRYRGGLTHHRKVHAGLRPFSCPECPQRYVSRSDLNNHFKSCHEGSGEYQCEVCGKSFVTQVRLDKHKKLHEESRETFVCDICGKVLASAFTLKFHMHIHTGERHVLCEVCGKGFKKKCDLSKHMNHHMGIKPHQCHLCQQRFCLKSDLEDHVRGHEGASLYQCDVCDKKFKNKRSVARCKRRHAAQASAAAEEAFQCNTCGDVMGTLVEFTQHMDAHVHAGEQVIQQEVEIE